MAKPFESYFGGKGGSGVCQAIINQIPPHETYGELFLGNGSIFRAKKLANNSILIDASAIVIEKWRNHLPKQAESQVQLINGNAIEILEEQREALDCSASFLYLDPPYPFFVRKSSEEVYEFELTDEQHIHLLGVISSYKNANVMISSYPNEMYDETLSQWRKVDFVGQTRHGKVVERIYMNYQEPTELHDYQYVGKDFRDRWRIEKKIRGMIKKLEKLPEIERNAHLEAIRLKFVNES
ncbi:hypothetical protein [Runella limosa]|uniref:hypothetical protein n=1 Tax=Runella limosa TaxID=370978 RepID=UPI00042319E7|nr:hypothetical protein [Runella limosa]